MLETKLQAAPTARTVDRLSTLTFERELALPSESRPIRGFIGDGSRFWVRGSIHTWLFGIGRDEPERTLRSLELGRVEYLDESLALVVQNETIYVHDALGGARRFGITIQPPPRAVRLAGAGATLFMVDAHVAAHELSVLATYPGATELVVVDRSSGALLWRAEAEKGSGSTPCTVSGRVVFATPKVMRPIARVPVR